MPNPNAPVKTPLGQQELRERTQRLGQRYRTVLLLVDGRRPLAEVLSMAHQAGAQTAHFEELLRLGMIELPPPPPEPAAPPPEPSFEAAGEEPVIDGPQEAMGDAAVAPAPGPGTPEPVPGDPEGADAVGEPEVARAATRAGRAARQQRLDEARSLLVDTLREDTLLQRVFAPVRVRAAQTQEELIGLVWEIERERAHVRRTRGQLLNLQRARDLLGMGNTVVAEDSLPWTPPREDDD